MTLSLENCIQTDSMTIEFDLMAVSDGAPSSDLRASSFQFGINFNTGNFKPGSVFSTVYAQGTSEFIPPLNGFNYPTSVFPNHLRIVQAVFGGGNTGITMAVGQKYRVGRFRLYSSLNIPQPFKGADFSLQDSSAGGHTTCAAIVWIGG